jgi:hypothetical protein
MPPKKQSDSESTHMSCFRMLTICIDDIYCWFCQPGSRQNHSNMAFRHHMNKEHGIDSYLLYTSNAYGVQCRIMIPYTFDCPYEVCGDNFTNPNDHTFGNHMRKKHKNVDVPFQKDMEAGKYFWWTTQEVDGQCKYVFCSHSSTHTY